MKITLAEIEVGLIIVIMDIHSFIHSGHFYSAPSSPLLLRGTPDYSTATVSEFHAEAHIAIRTPCIQNDKTLCYNEWIHLTNFYLRLLVVEHLLLIAQLYLLLLTVLVLKKSYN